MGGGAVKYTVEVWEQSCEVNVYQKSKTVWIAAGEYLGQTVVAQDRTSTSALSAWRKKARYIGND
jgi:hypothetical protein